jgi:hypothetical protein
MGIMQVERIGVCFFSFALLGLAGCDNAKTTVASPTAAANDSAPINDRPPTVKEASSILDLRRLELVPGSEEPGGRSVARLVYQPPGTPREAFDFHKKQLAEQKWSEAPGGTATDESVSGTFLRDGYVLSLSASSSGGDKPVTMVFAANHGNLSLKTLPRPENSEVLYEFPVSLAYVTPTPVDAVAANVDKALQAAGWEPYGKAGDTRFYRQKAIRLLATIGAAPAQDGKTVVTYFTELLSAELPAPTDAKQLQYSEPPVQLTVDYAGDLAAADGWYRERLGKMGWKPTTENPVKQGFEHFVIYRNEPGEMLEINFREIDDFTRLTLRFTTAEEFAEMEKRWEEQQKKAEKATKSSDR